MPTMLKIKCKCPRCGGEVLEADNICVQCGHEPNERELKALVTLEKMEDYWKHLGVED